MQYTKYYKSLMKAVGRLKVIEKAPVEVNQDTSHLGTILNEISNSRFGRMQSMANKPHILVCAQSNGAVDEILYRLKLKVGILIFHTF